jgi:hypothetical protein
VNTSNSNNGASGVLAMALEKFTVVITASIQTWQEGQNLILMGKIMEMERAANANSTTTACSTPREANKHPITLAHDNTTTVAPVALLTTTSVPVATSRNDNITTDTDASDASDTDNNNASSVATTNNNSTTALAASAATSVALAATVHSVPVRPQSGSNI